MTKKTRNTIGMVMIAVPLGIALAAFLYVVIMQAGWWVLLGLSIAAYLIIAQYCIHDLDTATDPDDSTDW